MRKLWSQDNVSHEGRYWRFSGVSINPKPVQHPSPVWIGGDADGPVRRAARPADAWLIAPWLPPRLCAERIEFYRRALHEHGREAPELPIRRDIYVVLAAETARQHTAPILEAGYHGFTADQLQALSIGGPEEVIAQIEQYRASGCTHFLFRHIVREQRQMLSSIQLLGAKVLPFFSGDAA